MVIWSVDGCLPAAIYCAPFFGPGARQRCNGAQRALDFSSRTLLIRSMGERSLVVPRPTVRTLTAAIDVVLLTPRDGTLAVLLLRADARARDRWLLPWDAPRNEESPDETALRVAKSILGVPPAALDQIGAFGDGRRHPGDAQLSISFVGLVPQGAASESV